MNKRSTAAILSTAALLGFSGPAAAGQPNSVTHPTENGGAGVLGAGNLSEGGGSLPFTGFEAGLVLLGGAGIALTGLGLRRRAPARG
jgi:hypothetical protein